MENPYHALFEKIAQEFSLDPLLVAAVSWQESGWTTDAFRYEPAFYERYLKTNSAYIGAVPRRVAASYGLLQVMAPTARDYGFTGEPEELFVPAIGVKWGCYILSQLIRWADGDVKRALAAYNAGKGGANSAVGQRYAQKVLLHLDRLKVLDKSAKL